MQDYGKPLMRINDVIQKRELIEGEINVVGECMKEKYIEEDIQSNTGTTTYE